MTRTEGRRRVHAAAELSAQTTLTGQGVAPRHPNLAGLEATGRLGREHRDIALECLRTLRDRFGAPSTVLTSADRSLARYAPELDPEHYRTLARHLIELDYPDGLLPDDDRVAAAREVHLRSRRDGSYTLTGTLTGECGARLAAILDTLSRPAPGPGAGDDPSGEPAERDLRTPAQRRHDGLQTACSTLLRSDLPQHGGVPTSVIVTIALSDLLHQTGTGTTADGQHLSPAAVGRLLHEAELLPTVIDHTGRVRWQETHTRIATAGQTRYLIARDGGCSFPGCDQPPAHCERHHLIDWARGGRTHTDNLTLLCGYHHRHHQNHGWTCTMINGLPHWIPPRWMDPTQQPRLHYRITLSAHHLTRRRT